MDDDLKRIAARIRSWRDSAGLTLQKLGERSGVSASTIHKIENLQTVPTIAILIRVANGLNRRPSELFEEIDEGNQVAILRLSDRKRFAVNEHAELEHLVGMIPRNRLDVWRVRLGAGRGAGKPGEDAWKFRGELVIIVEEGCIEIELGGKRHLLEAGDSIHFDSSLPHRWIAGRDEPASLIAFAMIPEHLQADITTRTVVAAEARSFEIRKAQTSTGVATAELEAS